MRRPLRIWSAGCATGEEPYSLAMVMQDFAEQCAGFHFLILGTDISTSALETASRGIYAHQRAETVPPPLRKKYLMRSRDRNRALVRMVPELRAKVAFTRLNLVEEKYGIQDRMEIIFCRNVVIYFEKVVQERLIFQLCSYLVPGGYLFMGHSETLHGMKLPLKQVSPMTYRKVAG